MRMRIIIEIETSLTRKGFNSAAQAALLPARRDLFVPSSFGDVQFIATEVVTGDILSHDGKSSTTL